jgi:uncharacterized membrane protein HdeD (DUF308 family)
MVSLTITLSAVLAIIVGLLVLVFPKLLRVALGLYLIIVGILRLLPGV